MALSKIQIAFRKYPIISNAVVYGGMCVTAEFSQQIVNKRIIEVRNPPEPIDKGALLRFAIVGCCINSNMLYFWYKWLDRKFPGRTSRTVMKKLVLDQFILTPHLLAAFYISMSILEGKENIFEEFLQKFIPTFKKSCLFWLPAQTLNFLFIPPIARVVYVGTCSFIWVNILCWLKRMDINLEKGDKIK